MTIREDDAAEVTAPAGAGPGEAARLLIVDDHEGVRRGVIRLIATSPDFTVVGEAADGAAAVAQAERLRPDVVLMDVSMPGVDGVRATTLLAGLTDAPDVVLFTAWADRHRIAEAMAAGAHGHVLKDAPGPDLLQTLRDASKARRARAESPPLPAAGGVDRGRAPGRDAPAVPLVASISRRRAGIRSRPARVAGLAALVVLTTAGPAAAREGALPAPMQAAARFVGLPTPSTGLDRARDSLDRLEQAIHRGDRAAAATAVAGLQRETAALGPSDRARIAGAASVALDDAARLLAPPVPVPPSAAPAPVPGTAAPGGPAAPAPGPRGTPGPTGVDPVVTPGDDHRHGGSGGQGGGDRGGGPGPPTTAPSTGGGAGGSQGSGDGGGGLSTPPATSTVSTAVTQGTSASGGGGSGGPGPSGGGGGGGGGGPSGR
jgi:CheY-like chemotaxis protein